jgi:hypothetical protein
VSPIDFNSLTKRVPRVYGSNVSLIYGVDLSLTKKLMSQQMVDAPIPNNSELWSSSCAPVSLDGGQCLVESS